jgi:hypothetical protein
MRIYKNCKQAMNEIKRNLYEMGITVFPNSMQNKIVWGNDDFSTKELQNECFTILDTSDKDEMVSKDLEWCKACDKGLPSPDVIIYLDMPIEDAAKVIKYDCLFVCLLNCLFIFLFVRSHVCWFVCIIYKVDNCMNDSTIQFISV